MMYVIAAGDADNSKDNRTLLHIVGGVGVAERLFTRAHALSDRRTLADKWSDEQGRI